MAPHLARRACHAGERSEALPYVINDVVEVVDGEHQGLVATVASVARTEPLVYVVFRETAIGRITWGFMVQATHLERRADKRPDECLETGHEPLLVFPLHAAAQDGDLEWAARLLAEGWPLDAFDQLSYSPLHYAVDKGHLQLAELLLECGADVNAVDPDVERIGESPITALGHEAKFVTVKFLVEHGADPTIPGWMGMTALDTAACRKDGEGVGIHRLLLKQARKLGHDV